MVNNIPKGEIRTALIKKIDLERVRSGSMLSLMGHLEYTDSAFKGGWQGFGGRRFDGPQIEPGVIHLANHIKELLDIFNLTGLSDFKETPCRVVVENDLITALGHPKKDIWWKS